MESPAASSTTVLVSTVIFFMRACGVGYALGAGEIRFPDKDGHMAGIFGEEHAFFRRGKPAAHHKDLLAG